MNMVGTVESLAEVRDALAAYIYKATGATTTVKLFKNDYTPNEATVVGDLTVADFTGYADFAIAAWDGTFTDAVTGLPEILSASGNPSFVQSGVGTTNLVYGMWIQFNTEVMMAARFDNPVNMDAAGKRIDLFLQLFPSAAFGPQPLEE